MVNNRCRAFVAKLNGATGAVSYGTFIGTTADDRIFGIAVNPATTGEHAYVTGETAGMLSGKTSFGQVDGFVVKLGNAGAESWRHQFGGGFDTRGNSIALDAAGTNVLSRLGLPTGTVPPDSSETVTSRTTAREGQYFVVSVDNGPPKKVEVESDDTFGFLAFKIREAIGAPDKGSAGFEDGDIARRFLKITALNGHKIELSPGRGDLNGLVGLGLSAGAFYGETTDPTSLRENSKKVLEKVEAAYGLGLTSTMSLKDKASAADAETLLDNAIRIVKKAYRLLTEGPEEPFKFPTQPPAHLQKQIAQLQGALDRLSGATQQSAAQFGSFFAASNLLDGSLQVANRIGRSFNFRI